MAIICIQSNSWDHFHPQLHPQVAISPQPVGNRHLKHNFSSEFEYKTGDVPSKNRFLAKSPKNLEKLETLVFLDMATEKFTEEKTTTCFPIETHKRSTQTKRH